MILCGVRSKGIQSVFVFARLNVTSQVATHLVSLEMLLFKQTADAWGFSATMKRLVSSAKRRIFYPIALTILLIYDKKNSIGKKNDPWGTPAYV